MLERHWMSSRKLEAGIGAVIILVTGPELIKASRAIKRRLAHKTPTYRVDPDSNSMDSGDFGRRFSSSPEYTS